MSPILIRLLGLMTPRVSFTRIMIGVEEFKTPSCNELLSLALKI
jgi:hypothetical protein